MLLLLLAGCLFEADGGDYWDIEITCNIHGGNIAREAHYQILECAPADQARSVMNVPSHVDVSVESEICQTPPDLVYTATDMMWTCNPQRRYVLRQWRL